MAKTICPLCGTPLSDPEQTYSLRDGEICRTCADDLRFLYPMLYLPKGEGKPDLSLLPQCQGLPKKDLTLLKRSLEEFTCSWRLDRMHLLTLEEFRSGLLSADACENGIRTQYLDYTHVLPVDFARPLSRPVGRDGIQNLRRRRRGFCVTGMIRAGQFKEGDMVGILHDGTVRYADILALDYENAPPADPETEELRTQNAEALGDRGERGVCIRAGYQVTMVLNEKAEGVRAGDWIVAD